jgi:hypothetical protein
MKFIFVRNIAGLQLTTVNRKGDRGQRAFGNK